MRHGGSSLTRDGTGGPLHWECEVLTTGPPGKSLSFESLGSDLTWLPSVPGAFVMPGFPLLLGITLTFLPQSSVGLLSSSSFRVYTLILLGHILQ